MNAKGIIVYLITLVFPLINHAQEFKVFLEPTALQGQVFSPAFWQNKLVVCCDQKDRIYSTVKDKHGNEPIDLYVFTPGKPDSVVRFDEVFRTIYHDGPIAFNGANDFAVVSRNLKTDQKYKNLQKDENHLGLYFSNKIDNKWTDPHPFTFNDTAYNCSHPTINYRGDMVIFASNMPGGQGGFDLWKTELVNGSWSKPKNLGPSINTEKDELFPYVYGFTLYFSSNRDEFGGLDIYQTSIVNDGRKTQILDASLNSEFDDFGLISSNKLKTGYFSSNRDGKDQLYAFEFQEPVFENCDSLVETVFCYTLTEEYAYELGEVGALKYFWNVNGERLEGISIDYCFPGPGDYEVTIDIEDTVVNQTYFEQSYYYLSLALEEQPYISAPDTISPFELFMLSANETYLPNLTIEDDQFYWQLSDGSRFRGKTAVHEFTAQGIYEIRLGVIGNDGENDVKDCVYRTIVCLDPDFPVELEYINTVKEELYMQEPNDEKVLLYTIEVERSQTKPDPDKYDFSLIDPSHDYKLSILEEDGMFISTWGAFSDSTLAEEYKLKLRQLGYEESDLKSLTPDELLDLELELADFFRQHEKEQPEIFLSGENLGAIDVKDEKNFYAHPSDTNLVVFSIELLRTDELLPEDNDMLRLLDSLGFDEIRFIEDDSSYLYLSGDYDEFHQAHEDWKYLQQLGISGSVLRSFNMEDISDFEINTTFSFNNIQFDSDKWNLRPEAISEIDKILDVMKLFPTVKLEISAHTDATASASYNLTLSNLRAKSVFNYLISNGLDKNRINYKGYGESRPIDTNETEAGKQNNRRVEFILQKP